MKKVFGAIGGFFKRIWRWIAETAWIQPLLIVGLIFAVIFSIPSISSWISNASESSGRYAYYNANVLKSKDLLEYEDKGYEALYEKGGEERFLVVFIEENCEYCEQDEEAFKLFSKKQNWNHDGNQVAAPSVHFVYCNYEEKDDSSEAEAWRDFVEVANLYDTVEEYYKETCDLYTHINEEASYLSPMEGENPKLPTPLIAYYEKGEMQEVIMGLEGSTDIERMQYLRDFYYHLDDFKR